MTKQFRHGLVIGKFYPPHAGHEYLIRSAADACDTVSVVVMASSVESIPLPLRVEWLREMFATRSNAFIVGVMDDDPIDFQSDAVWAAHVAHMQHGVDEANALRRATFNGPQSALSSPDVVFTSESYGAELARRLGTTHVCLDQSRVLYPVSGTLVRSDPVRHWDLLAPCVRNYFCRRVVIIGAESTGKTTLADALVEAFRDRGGLWSRTQSVAEYGREYTINKIATLRSSASIAGIGDLRWESTEFEHIAATQVQWEQQAARTSSPIIVCDTDAFATETWHERYLGYESDGVRAIAAEAVPRLCYILTGWEDVSFQQDGIRDGETIREWMHQRFAHRLASLNVPTVRVTGSAEQRLEASLYAIDQLMRSTWRFTDPLG